jgi:UDP-glucose 4-epimerase
MNILIVGSAGHVGSIVRPALEERYNCYHFDLRPVPGVVPVADGGRGYVADLGDHAMLRHAMIGMDVVINLAMGVRPGTSKDVTDIDPVFDVNVRGCYRIVLAATGMGVRRIVNASSLSVYNNLAYREPITEETPTDGWYPYAMSKRLGESICEAAVQHRPYTGIVSLRLMHPATEESFRTEPRGWHVDLKGRVAHACLMGPNDTRRLFVAAVEYTINPGHHIFQATGEVDGEWFPYTKAAEKMGWRPRGD